MKRVIDCGDEEEESTLWKFVDVVWLIVELDIYMSGPLARTSHTLLKTMCSTEILQNIIHVCKEEWRVIPKWLRFPLPHHYFLEDSDPLKLYLELEVIPTLSEVISQKPLDSQCVLVGSLVTGLFYNGVKWENSDVDLLIKRDHDYEHTKTVIKFLGKKWDIVQMCEDVPLLHYVGHFDQSLVQMCLPQNERSLYLTPLAIYTQRTKICLVTLTDENIYYIGANQNGDEFRPNKNGSLDTIIDKHRNKHLHKELGIHQCSACRVENLLDKPFTKWIYRMRKYQNRFPDYKFIYLLAEHPIT